MPKTTKISKPYERLLADKTPQKRRTTKKKSLNKLSKLSEIKEGFAKGLHGTKIWYQSRGSGLPIVFCNGLGCSTFYWKHIAPHFEKKAQVIQFDWRAHGNSTHPKDPSKMTIDGLAKDLNSVLKALKIQKAVLVGHSMGVQVMLHFYKLYPKKALALIPCLGTFKNPLDTFYNSPKLQYIFEAMYIFNHLFPKLSQTVGKLVRANPLNYQVGGLFQMLNPGLADRKAIKQYMDHLTKIDPVLLSKLIKSMQNHSAESVLKKISVPTLIFAGEKDKFTPMWIAKKMHKMIAHSELQIIRKASHVALVEQPELINLRLEKFLRETFRQDI